MWGEPNERYVRYINSPEWKAKRQEAFDYHGRVCAHCGAGKYLEVHHLTYKRFGSESVHDLEIVCGDCHIFADILRKRALKEKRDIPLMEKWAAETYGPKWDFVCDWPDMMERFQVARCEAANKFFATLELEDYIALHGLYGTPRSAFGGA